MSAQRLWTGLVFIIAGVLFLLNTTGVLSWGIWFYLAQLWPILLISLGITMLFGRSPLAFIGPLLLIVLVAVTAYAPQYMGFYIGEVDEVKRSFEAPLEPGVEQARLIMDFGAGRIRLSSGSDLVNAELNYVGFVPTWQYRRIGSTAEVEIKSNLANRRRIHFFGSDSIPRLYSSVGLNPDIPWEISLDVGAADLQADLTNVSVKSFTLDIGAGKVDLYLGDSGCKSYVEFNSGLAKLYISVPNHVGLRVFFSGGLNSTNLADTGLMRRGDDEWISPNWESASSSYDIRISNGVGKIDVVRIGSGKSL